MDELILEKLSKTISDSVRERAGRENVSVMFSGGLDSTLVAFLAKRFNPKTKLYTIGTNDSQDVEWARKVSEEIDGELRVKILSEEEVLSAYSETKAILRTEHLLSLELGMAVLLCSRMSNEDGAKTLLSGHGADELFGGYSKYHAAFSAGKEVETMMTADLELALNKDMKESELIAGLEGVRIAFPFLDETFLHLARSVPIEKHFGKAERKPVLREIAKILGVPEAARTRPKKAMQYGSGIHKILDKKFGKGAVPKEPRRPRKAKPTSFS